MPYANSPRPDRTPPSVCPNCGESVPRKALACPECGADWETGWRDLGYAGGGSRDPEDDFDYDAAFNKEFGAEVKPEGIRPIWWVTGLLLLAVFLIGALRAIL